MSETATEPHRYSTPHSGAESCEEKLDLVSNHTDLLLGRARRFSLSREDAEDAYQRSLEILLTKAPPGLTPNQLLRWSLTVVKHEALAVRNRSQRTINADPNSFNHLVSPGSEPPEWAERFEHVDSSLSTLKGLKKAETTCVVLKAVGYSYNEICSITGYSWTKVNRSISEGRAGLRQLVSA